MGLPIHHAIVVRYHTFCRDVLGLGVVAVGAGGHDGETLLVKLGLDLGVKGMALQRGCFRMDRSEAELAVMTALHGFGVIGVIGVFVGHNIVQLLGEAGSAVVKVIHVFGIVIGTRAAVTVHCAAVFAAGFGPVVAGVISVDAGIAVKDRSGSLAVNRGPIGILDIPRQRGLAVAGVFRGAPDREGRVLPTVVAVKCLMGNDGIDVQLVGAAPGVHPMLGGVTIG